jgi:hypothetical protein
MKLERRRRRRRRKRKEKKELRAYVFFPKY